jgi:sec-independent protein translocase protein TatC
MSNVTPNDPDDFFAETRMSFGDHIEELRVHLWRSIYGFGIALFFSFFIGHQVLQFIKAPVTVKLREFYNRRVDRTLRDLNSAADPNINKANQATPFVRHGFSRKQLDLLLQGKPTAEINAVARPTLIKPQENPEEKVPSFISSLFRLSSGDARPVTENEEYVEKEDVVYLWMNYDEPLRDQAHLQEAMRIVGDFDAMSTLNIQEAFMAYVKVSMVCGFVLGSPWIFFQLWAFVAAGLYPHERKYIHYYLPFSLALFLGGVVLCEALVIPKAIEALLWFNEWLDLKPDLRLNEWLGFAIFLPVVFGLSFQTPLVMLFFERLGIMNADDFRSQRRIAWFGLAIFVLMINPSTDLISFLLLWVSMSLLFEFGILLIIFSPKPPSLEVDAPDGEMIEV